MNKFIIYAIIAFFFFSCENKIPEKEILIDFKPNENIILFKVSKILNNEYSKKRPDSLFSKNLDPKTDTIKYTEKEIYISYLGPLTGCVKYGGDIEIKHDSLFLKLVPINNEVCSELLIGRIVYKIKNPNNKNFKVKKHN